MIAVNLHRPECGIKERRTPMEFIQGTMTRVNQLLQIKNRGYLAFFSPSGGGSDVSRYVDLGWKRRMAVDEADYLLLCWDGKLSLEKLTEIEFEEQEDGKKLLKLVPFLKSRKIGYTCISGNCEGSLYSMYGMPAWRSGIHYDEAIVCEKGYAYQSHSWFDGDDTYVLNVCYMDKRLKVGGEDICAWQIDWHWATKSLWRDDILTWIKGSFEKEQSLSQEKFCGLLEQWGLGGLIRETFLWPWGGTMRRLDSDWTEENP